MRPIPLPPPLPDFANDHVCCANGRGPDRMRIARGSGLCQMGPRFSFAERDVGGPGRPCSRR